MSASGQIVRDRSFGLGVSNSGEKKVMLGRLSIVAALSVTLVSGAMAQEGGIWAARPHRHIAPEETVPASALPGLAPGLTVQTTDGRSVGTVSKVVTASDGSIRKVVVMSRAGNLMKVSPTALSVSNGVVTMQPNSGS